MPTESKKKDKNVKNVQKDTSIMEIIQWRDFMIRMQGRIFFCENSSLL